MSVSQVTVEASFYIYFLALSAGMGFATAGAVAYHLHQRWLRKSEKVNKRVK